MHTTETASERTVLNNGIRLVTERIPYVRSVAIGVWLSTGSANETRKNNGIAHFIEHMMFKGTVSRSTLDIAESLESVGGSLNAFTGKELTCYYAHVLDEHLDLAIDVISDILLNSVFDEAEMTKEKQVIIEELNAIEETPEELIHELFLNDLFPDHPLGFSIIGTRDNIQGFTREHIVDFLQANYAADHIVVAAAGNVEHTRLAKLVEARFSGLHLRGNAVSPGVIPPTHGTHIVENGAIQAHLCLGTQAYSYQNPKKFALLVLNTLLGAGMSSRLFQNLRETHALAYSVYSFVDFLHDTGLFGIYVGTDRQKIDESLALIDDELRRFRLEPISEIELERTKSQLKGNLMLGLENTSSRMNRLARMEIYLGEHFTLDDTLQEIDSVSGDNVLEVANELFLQERLFTTVLKPK